jgi:hypothetical protein
MSQRFALLLLLCGLLAPSAHAQSTFDHTRFDTLLRRHVVDGLVDYDAFKAAPEFAAYLASLAQAEPAKLDQAERLAFWINTYNAYTIQLIVSHGERASIRNINKTLGLKLKGPWKQELVHAGGQRMHLDHVEHEIIRKQFQEPRIHFALVCAALGCPPLRSEAFTGARLEQQLADQTRVFLLASPTKNRVDVQARVVYASMIYGSYYREDFGGSDAAIGRYLAGVWPPGPERELLESGRFRLQTTEYDWTLNSQEMGRRSGPKP